MISPEETQFAKAIKSASNLFGLLSEPHRLSVLAILTYGEYTVSDIYKCLRLRQNLISHHLKVLRSGGIVKCRRHGREIYYSLNRSGMDKFREILTKIMRNEKN